MADLKFIDKYISDFQEIEAREDINEQEKNAELLELYCNFLDITHPTKDSVMGVALNHKELLLKNKERIYFILDRIQDLFVKSLIRKNEYMIGDLKSIYPENSDFTKEYQERSKQDEYNITLLNTYNKLIIRFIEELDIFAEVNVTVDRKIKGKIPKKKKDERLEAERIAQELWAKNPYLTQENIALKIMERLNLTQTLQTVIRWTKHYQPKKIK